MTADPTASHIVYVGCRTTRERNAHGDGISVYRMQAGGLWDPVQLVDDLVNPSFLALDHGHRCLYTVHGDRSEVSAFRIDRATGRLHFLNRQSCQGRNPCHLVVTPDNRFLIVANHVSSTLAVLPIAEDGALGEVIHLVELRGTLGPHRIEQTCAKPHQVVFDPTGRFLAVPDKGLDRVFSFTLDAETGRLSECGSVAAREGSGPRHIAFHPDRPFAYVINELDSTITCYRSDAGTLTPFQIVSALPDSFTGNSRAAEIEVSADGRFVYGSNRGCDSIAAFAVAPDGTLSPVGWTDTQGRTPRFFVLSPDGSSLHVANEDSDSIVCFAVDTESGSLHPTGETVATGSPVCILFSPIG